MAATLSKRQQARNESVLQDLVQSVPGNNLCADCYARNPSWASWSLGVFLCMRCAAIHRKLGTHISKVKSLSMDAWTNEQVDNMRKVGNVVSNKIYNPENRKPPIPIDTDEVDSAMERFIRQKYIINTSAQPGKKKAFVDEDTPPPLPPKNSKFGFRSASSIFPLSSRSKKDAKQVAHDSSSTLSHKQSKVFGAATDHGGDDMDAKLAQLRDMGFADEHRNDMILRGVNGHLERAVEALIRLGSGDRSPAPGASSADGALRSSRSLTPVNPGSGSTTFGAGLVVPGNSVLDRPTSATTPSTTNPFDMAFDMAPPQTALSTGAIHSSNPYLNSTNPFGLSSQPSGFSNQPLQTLPLPQAQPLFPHHTGGGVVSQSSQFSRFQSPTSSTPSFTSPYQGAGLQGGLGHQQPGPQPLMPQQTGYNPFFTQQQQQQQQQPQATPFHVQNQQMMMPSNLAQAQAQVHPAFANTMNPFQRTPTRIASPPLTQIPEQAQPQIFQMPQQLQQLQPQHTSTNPFLNNMMQQPTSLQASAQPFDQQHQQHQHQPFWQPKRQDKASILALYNQPPRAMQPPLASPVTGFPGQMATGPEDLASAGQTMDASAVGQPSRSISQPMPSSTNPFMKNGPTSRASDVFTTDRKTSRESMNLGMDMAWTNGRHSPDAFASLSARHV